MMAGDGRPHGWYASAGRMFARLEELLIVYLLAAMTINTFGQVVARRLFNSGTVWANELTQLLFAYLVMLGMSYGIRQGGHMGVDFVVSFAAGRTRRALNLVAVALCLIYALAMGAAALSMAWTYRVNLGFLTTEDLNIPVWINYAIVATGFALITIRLIGVGIEVWQGVRDGVPLPAASEELERSRVEPS